MKKPVPASVYIQSLVMIAIAVSFYVFYLKMFNWTLTGFDAFWIPFIPSIFMLVAIGLILRAFDLGSDLITLRKAFGFRAIRKDGEKIAITGKLISILGNSLNSPATKISCLGYQYEMYHTESGPGDNERTIYDFGGFVMSPVEIKGVNESLPILGIPILQGFPMMTFSNSPKNNELFRNMGVYIPQRNYTMSENCSINTTMMQLDDVPIRRGDYRIIEKRKSDKPIDISKLILNEMIIPIDQEVTAIGTWSESLKGIINANGTKGNLTLIKGGLHSTFMRLTLSVLSHLITGLGIAAFINVIVYLISTGVLVSQ